MTEYKHHARNDDATLWKMPANPSKWRKQTIAIRFRKSKIMLYVMEHPLTTINQIKEKKTFAGSKKDIDQDCDELIDCGAIRVFDLSPQIRLLAVFLVTENELAHLMNPFVDAIKPIKLYAASKDLKITINESGEDLLKFPQIRQWYENYKDRKDSGSGKKSIRHIPINATKEDLADIVARCFYLNELRQKFLDMAFRVIKDMPEKDKIMDRELDYAIGFLVAFRGIIEMLVSFERKQPVAIELARPCLQLLNLSESYEYCYDILVRGEYGLSYRLKVFNHVLDGGITYARDKLGLKTNDSVIRAIEPIRDKYRNPDFEEITKRKLYEKRHSPLLQETPYSIIEELKLKHSYREFFKNNTRNHPEYKKIRRRIKKRWPEFVMET